MIDGVVRTLVIAVGLLVIWWLCGRAGQRDLSREGDESRESDARVDAQRR